MADAIIIDFPAVIKARTENDGRRLVSVQASVESCDLEGDVILQSALLASADSFVRHGMCDINHFAEIGHKIGVNNPESYIIGRPTKVWDGGETRTFVECEIMRSADGVHDPVKHRYDAFWDTLTSEPPVMWRSSIYGFPLPGAVEDCSTKTCESGAWRYLVKGIDWKSLAFTQTPMNDKLTGYARIVTAKAFIDGYAKNGNIAYDSTMPHLGPTPKPYDDSPPALPTIGQSMMLAPRNLHDAIGQHPHILRECAEACGVNTTVGFRKHFEICCGMDGDAANVYAHALMHHLHLERGRK